MKLKLLELFGGIGAPRKALENIGVDVKSVDYVEILTNAVKAYNAMYDNNYKEQNVLDWNLNVDLLVHGSPCQDFSKAGRNDPTSGRSILYNRTLEIIEKELKPRPKFVVWENVTGLLSPKHIQHFNHYLETMEQLGYRNYYSILEAKEFGVPQTRPRVFTVSIRDDINKKFDFCKLERKPLKPLMDYLTDLENSKPLNQPSMISSLYNHKTYVAVKFTGTITTKQVRWNGFVAVADKDFYKRDFSNIPDSKSVHGYSIEEFYQYFPEYKGKPIEETFRYLTPRECWALMGYDTTIKEFKEFNNFFTIPRKSDGKLINGQYNRIWKNDKYVGTIPASVHLKIGYTNEKGELCYRELTPQETWLLQGYDLSDYDRVKASGVSDSAMYMLAGNSICVPVLEAIFKELLKEEHLWQDS